MTPEGAQAGESSTAQLDPERQVKARQYARARRRLWLVDTLAATVYSLIWLASGWTIALGAWLESYLANEWLRVAVFVAIFGSIYALLTLPLGYYSGFVLPHAFGQSTQSFKDWVKDQVKGALVGASIGLILLELLYLALRLTGNLWWLWAAAGMLLFQVILTNLAPVLIMPIFNKYIPLGEEHADLAERLIRLAERAHTKVRGVYQYDLSRRTKAANAALTGIGNTRRIILGDTLISEFTPDEIETVLAHELGHHVNHDIPWLIGFGTLTVTLGLYLTSLAMDWAVATFGFKSVADPAGFPALMLLLGAYGLVMMPLENSFSRWREAGADDYALRATGKNAAFATAFKRLANQNLGEVDPEGWVVWLFYDHPPLGERIAKAETWKPV